MPPMVALETASSLEAVPRLEHHFQENDRFRLPVVERDYHKQFASLYTRRLETTAVLLEARAREKWGKDVPIKKLFQIQDAGRCILIGALYRRMALRPSILTEVSEDYHLRPPMPPKKRFAADENDTLFIEDQVQRIPLAGNINVKEFVTGVTIALIGMEARDESGRFMVEGHLCLGEPLHSEIDATFLAAAPTACEEGSNSAPHLLIVSGLNFGAKDLDNILSSQLLANFVTGSVRGLSVPISNVVRLIVAGNSISKETRDKDWTTGPKFRQKKTNQESLDALKDMDEWLAPIVTSVDVDLLPGDSDPAAFLWPQQPIHSCLFPRSARSTGFHSRSNPYACSLANRRILGTSGQNVADVIRCSTIEGAMAALRKTLLWRHLAPTAPDTLCCYPFLDRDPFVIESAPDLYFVGNCDRFEQCWIPDPMDSKGGTLCITVPDFSKTRTAVLVNLETLSCQAIVCQDLELEFEDD